MRSEPYGIPSFYTPPTILAFFCIAAIATGSVFSGCGLLGSDDGDGSDALVPLEEGESWTYQFTDNIDDEESTFVIQANGTGSATVSGDESFTLIIQDKEESLSIHPSGQPEEAVPFRYPADPGDTYTFRAGSPDSELHTVEVSMESVTVPAGSFDDCLTYKIYRGDEFDETDEPNLLYFKPGTGLVRVAIRSRPTDEGRLTRSEYNLVSTSLD